MCKTWRTGALGMAIGAAGMYVFLCSTRGSEAKAPIAPTQAAVAVSRSEAPPRLPPSSTELAAAIAKAVATAGSDARTESPAPAPVAAAPQLCASVMDHIFAIELANATMDVEAQRRAARAREQLEAACRERWSAQQIDCMEHADAPYTLRRCRRPERHPMVEMPTSVAMDEDVRCEVVGKHLADLMLAQNEAPVTSIDEIEGFVTTNDEQRIALPGEVIDSCRNDDWADDLRRCYAGSTAYEQTIYCNLWFR